jgi:hypothetical protein
MLCHAPGRVYPPTGIAGGGIAPNVVLRRPPRDVPWTKVIGPGAAFPSAAPGFSLMSPTIMEGAATDALRHFWSHRVLRPPRDQA